MDVTNDLALSVPDAQVAKQVAISEQSWGYKLRGLLSARQRQKSKKNTSATAGRFLASQPT
jgi:hypothetical protein